MRTALALLVLATIGSPIAAQEGPRRLAEGWRLQSSANVHARGAEISQIGFDAHDWQAITVPNTVVGALTESGVYKNPYFGMNLRALPGMSYPIGSRFMLIPTPETSPFKPSWWYRTEFTIPATATGKTSWLKFDGINYRANVWLNGARIAEATEVAGAFRQFEFDVTQAVRAGRPNALAVEVFGPEPHDLSIMWVDWNPTPLDKNMGLWQDVWLAESGPVALRHPYAIAKLDQPSLDTAHMTVMADVWNATDRPVTAVVRGSIESITFDQSVSLAAHEKRTVTFAPDRFPVLDVRHPRVWWPYRMGTPDLYTLTMNVRVNGTVSDKTSTRFGIREVSSELTPEGARLFKINGKPILIRGGGWASDMMLRPKSAERLRAELGYVRAMGLNTIRLEGKLESDAMYDLADEWGILVMPGWCCCDQWEQWKKWDAEDYAVGPASLRDQLLRLRHHPSVFVWLNGSDNPPIAAVERKYLDIEQEVSWARPTLSSATEAPGPVSGPSGVKMRGPYEYVPPSYWLTDTKKGGAFGLATEISPGPAVPPLESLEEMLPPDHRWPIDDVWNFHAGGDEFKNINRFTEALEARYGPATGIADYARKAQALAYEGERAMFEGYARNKYKSTGVIQWMLNNAWPGLIWHLYDYYLRPGGGYFGTKKACEPLHVQYSYDDRSIVVVNDTLRDYGQMTVAAEVLNLDLTRKYSNTASVAIGPDAVVRAFALPAMEGLTKTYFVRLSLHDGTSDPVTNFYWLSTQEDVLDPNSKEWFYTRTARHADLTALAQLPPTSLQLTTVHRPAVDAGHETTVTVANTGSALAFQVRLKILDEQGREILPAYWDDNYLALLPGEKRTLEVRYSGGAGTVTAEAWNAPEVRR